MGRRRLGAVARHLVAAQPYAPADDSRGAIIPATKDPSCDLSGCRLADTWAEHRLSSAERQQFLRDGYVMIDDCLGAEDISQLTDALDWEHTVKSAEDQAAHDSAMPDAMNRMGVFSPANELSDTDALQRLLINQKVLPKIVDVLGWNISIYHAHANRSPPHVPGDAIRDGQFRPVAGESTERPPPGQEKTFAFHQDSGRVNKELETADGIVPRLSVKAIAYLTDVELDMGPTWIVPGSHKLTTAEFDALLPSDKIGQPAGAMPVLAKAGSVLLFDRRLRHSATPNWSQSTRKAYFIGYVRLPGFHFISSARFRFSRYPLHYMPRRTDPAALCRTVLSCGVLPLYYAVCWIPRPTAGSSQRTLCTCSLPPLVSFFCKGDTCVVC
jgi:ectoine hydroxylase